jgi:hypothetical protein
MPTASLCFSSYLPHFAHCVVHVECLNHLRCVIEREPIRYGQRYSALIRMVSVNRDFERLQVIAFERQRASSVAQETVRGRSDTAAQKGDGEMRKGLPNPSPSLPH